MAIINTTVRDWCPETGEDLLVVDTEKCKVSCAKYNECWVKRIDIKR